MRATIGFCASLLGLALTGAHAAPIGVDLGSAASFAVLAGSTVTSTGATTLSGNLGVWPGTAVTGFPPGVVVTGAIHAGDAAAQQAHDDGAAAYGFAAAAPAGTVLTGQDLGGRTLTPGTYTFDTSAGLTGALTLDAGGNAHAVFLFRIGSTLTTAGNSSVMLTNGGDGDSIVFQVGSSATLGSGTAFTGHILAAADITVGSGATIRSGGAFARDGAVTLSGNDISVDAGPGTLPAGVPEPASAAILGVGAVLALAGRARRLQHPAA